MILSDWKKVACLGLIVVMIWIYNHFKLYEAFAEAAPTAPTAPNTDTPPISTPVPDKVTSTKMNQSPLQASSDVGLYNDNTAPVDENTRLYIQKQIASMVPMIMDTFTGSKNH